MKRFCLVSIQSIVWIVNYFVQCESQHPGILGWKLWKVLQSWTEYVVFKIHVSVLFLLSWEVSLELETLLWKNKHRVSNTHPGCPELLESEGFPQISLNLKIFLEFPWFWKKLLEFPWFWQISGFHALKKSANGLSCCTYALKKSIPRLQEIAFSGLEISKFSGADPQTPTKLPPTNTLHGAAFCILYISCIVWPLLQIDFFPTWKLNESCGIFILFQVLVLKNKGQAACYG